MAFIDDLRAALDNARSDEVEKRAAYDAAVEAVDTARAAMVQAHEEMLTASKQSAELEQLVRSLEPLAN
jgi:hypothetical protein